MASDSEKQAVVNALQVLDLQDKALLGAISLLASKPKDEELPAEAIYDLQMLAVRMLQTGGVPAARATLELLAAQRLPAPVLEDVRTSLSKLATQQPDPDAAAQTALAIANQHRAAMNELAACALAWADGKPLPEGSRLQSIGSLFWDGSVMRTFLMRFEADANREAAEGFTRLALLLDDSLAAEFMVGKLQGALQLRAAYGLCTVAVDRFPTWLPLRVQRISLGIESKLAPEGQLGEDLTYVAGHAPEGDERRQWARDLIEKTRKR
jgi:hypothetical protein